MKNTTIKHCMLSLFLLLSIASFSLAAPTHDTPLLTSTYGTNYTSENLTCYNQSTANATSNTFDWRKNGASLAVLDMTFDKNVSTTAARAISDYSTYQNNATLTGSAPIPQWVLGKIGGAYSLDGANDYISAEHSNSLNGNGIATEFTLEAWVKPSVSNNNGHIITKRNSTTAGSYQFGLDGTYTGRLFCTFYFGPGTSGSYTEALASVAGNPYLDAGNWYHIVCTYKNGTGVKVYVNGTLATSNPSSGIGDGTVRATAGVPLRLGARGNPAVERYFNGTIDEVKIYDRALSLEEIQNHYSLGYNMLLSNELSNGSSYTCAVTPTDGATDGLTKVSNALVATQEAGEPPANYDDVFFNSSFQSGNLYDVAYVGGDAGGNRVYNAKINYSTLVSGEYHWWFFFKMTNASGKNIRVNITNPTATDFTNNRWYNLRPRFSYDFGQGNVDPSSADWSGGNWNALFSNSILYNAGARWFSFNISATQDTVWVAPVVPYTVLRRDRFLSSIAASPYAGITSLGTTTFGFNLSAVEVTDSAYPNANKKRVYIIGQQHANEEAQGSWEIEGAINYLLNDSNQTAQTLLQNYVFKFVPITNVDGVYNGTGRFSPLYNATTQWDPNRQWDDARAGTPTYNVVDWTYADIGNFAPNASLDLHGSMNGESPTIPVGTNYFLLDKAADSTTNAFAGNISANIPYIFSNWNVVTNAQSMPVNAYLGFGVHPSFTFESTATNISLAFIPTYSDWVNWGSGLLLGIHGYFNATGNSPSNQAPTITINSPQNTTYETPSILINISSNGVSTWYEHNNTNYTYSSPTYLTFQEGAHTLNVWSNNSFGNTSSASVSFSVTSPPNYDDVFFNSSFQSGNLHNVTFVSGDASGNRLYRATMDYSNAVSTQHHWWLFFKMENATNKNVKINITNPTSSDFTNYRWQNFRPRFSYDFGQGNVDEASEDWSAGNWGALSPSSIAYSQASLWFSFNISSTQNTVWVASNVPYTVLRRDRFLASIAASPHINISSLGTSTFGFDTSALEVTDAAYQSEYKTRIYLVGQQHANDEPAGSWEIEGAINYLLNDSNPTAQTLLQNYIFKFVPILNVDGVYNGTGYFTPLYNGTTQWNPNSEWANARVGNATYNAVEWAYADIGDFAPDAALDLHSSINGESAKGIPAGVNYFLLCNDSENSTMAPFLSNISASIPYVFADKTQLSSVLTMSRNAFVGHNVYPSATFELSVTNVTSSFVPNYSDYMNWGAGILLGVHGYYKTTGNTEYGALPNITINSPLNTTYANATILINISSNGVFTWYEYNGTNYTYTSPTYSAFQEGAHTLNVWSNNSLGNISSASVSFYVSVPQNFVVSKNGGTFASVAGTGTAAWSNPSNAASSDASYATATLAKGVASRYLRATNFSFQIPSDATINGIVVTVVRKSSSSVRTTDNHVYLVKNNVTGGTDKKNLTNWSTSDTTVLYGSPTDLWGLSLSPSDINNATSGIAFSAIHTNSGSSGNYVASVNYINITVYYSAGGEGGEGGQAQAPAPPSIAINSPQNTTYSNATMLIDITSDGVYTWYEYNNTNYSYSSPEYRTFPEGANVLRVWSNNSEGNVSGASVSFTVNTEEVPLPTIAINSPLNTTYATRSILINITSNGVSTWYEYNGANYTYSNPISRNFNWGANVFKVWSNNSVGARSSANVSFYARR